MFDNKQLLDVIHTYEGWYKEGLEPTEKNFLYHDDHDLSTMVVSIMEFPYEISPAWKTTYEMNVPTRDDTYKEEVFSCMSYLQLRKIKRMININQKELEGRHSDNELISLLEIHKKLKGMEIEITKKLGTVILK